MHETLSRYEPGRALAWGVRWVGGIGLHCDRVQEVVPQPSGKTLYRSYESFRGVLAPLVVLLYGESVRKGFEACADALARRVEKR